MAKFWICFSLYFYSPGQNTNGIVLFHLYLLCGYFSLAWSNYFSISLIAAHCIIRLWWKPILCGFVFYRWFLFSGCWETLRFVILCFVFWFMFICVLFHCRYLANFFDNCWNISASAFESNFMMLKYKKVKNKYFLVRSPLFQLSYTSWVY